MVVSAMAYRFQTTTPARIAVAVGLSCTLALGAGGCGVVLPSYRTWGPSTTGALNPDAAHPADIACDGCPKSGGCFAHSFHAQLPTFGVPEPEQPGPATIRPPQSKFHPLPVRPVFLPAGVPVTAPFQVQEPRSRHPHPDQAAPGLLQFPDSRELPGPGRNVRPLAPRPPTIPGPFGPAPAESAPQDGGTPRPPQADLELEV